MYPTAGFYISRVEPSGSANSEVVRFFRYMQHSSCSRSLALKNVTIWSGIKECKDNIWHGDTMSRTKEVNEEFDIGIMYNELGTVITVYFNTLYQHFSPDLKLPWDDSCRAPVHIVPHCSPFEGCPNTFYECFAPANNSI